MPSPTCCSAELAVLDDYRWDNRLTRSQAVVKAVREYLGQPEAAADA